MALASFLSLLLGSYLSSPGSPESLCQPACVCPAWQQQGLPKPESRWGRRRLALSLAPRVTLGRSTDTSKAQLRYSSHHGLDVPGENEAASLWLQAAGSREFPPCLQLCLMPCALEAGGMFLLCCFELLSCFETRTLVAQATQYTVEMTKMALSF